MIMFGGLHSELAQATIFMGYYVETIGHQTIDKFIDQLAVKPGTAELSGAIGLFSDVNLTMVTVGRRQDDENLAAEALRRAYAGSPMAPGYS